jgi:hypothetical protein
VLKIEELKATVPDMGSTGMWLMMENMFVLNNIPKEDKYFIFY